MEGISGDFGNMDMSSYNDAIDQFQTTMNAGLASVADANKTAEEKVQAFNQAIQGSFTGIAGPVLAKGVGKTFGNIKSALSKRYGQAVDDAKQALQDKAEEAVEGAKKQVGELVDKVTNKVTGQTAPENPVTTDAIQETSIDDAIDAAKSAQSATTVTGDIAETSIDDAIASAGSSLQNVAPGFRVLADVTKPPIAQSGQPSTSSVANATNDANASSASVESGTDGV